MKTSSIPELKGGQMITIAYIGAFFIVLFIVYKLMAKVGLIKTIAKKKEEAKEEAAAVELRSMEYFNTTLISKAPFSYVPLGQVAITKAKELRSALRGLGTDEEAVFATFSKLKNRFNISEISLAYKEKYNDDLLIDILNDFNDEEKVTLIEIINKLKVL